MSKKREVVPSELLSKEFLSQFKTEADVSKFLKKLHSQVLEQMLQGEMDSHLGYEKHSVDGNNTGNSRNGSFPKKIQTEYGESVIQIPATDVQSSSPWWFPSTRVADCLSRSWSSHFTPKE